MSKFANAFGYNALFSLTSGIILIVFADMIVGQLIDAPIWLFQLIGAVLLGFAGLIGFAVMRDIPVGLGKFITLQDGLWVLITTALMAYFWSSFTAAGAVVLVGINVIVAVFGVAQWQMLNNQPTEPHAI